MPEASWARTVQEMRADVGRYRVTEQRGLLANLWLSPGLVATLHYRVAHHVWARPALVALRLPLVVLQRLVEVWSGVSLAPQASIGAGLYIGHFGAVIVNGGCTLGENCSLSQGVTLGVAGRGERRGCPTLGDRVYVAPGAKVVGPITIGDDAVVGANAVIATDVEPRVVVAGVPAKPLNRRGSFDFVLYPGMDDDPARSASAALAEAAPPSGPPR